MSRYNKDKKTTVTLWYQKRSEHVFISIFLLSIKAMFGLEFLRPHTVVFLQLVTIPTGQCLKSILNLLFNIVRAIINFTNIKTPQFIILSIIKVEKHAFLFQQQVSISFLS